MRILSSLVALVAGTATFTVSQTVPGTPPEDPAGYKSPYAMKTTPKESCERQYQHLLLQTQSKMRLMIGVTNDCKMAEALQDVAQDHINFNRRCPDFPAARQAAAVNEANAKALQMQCTRPLADVPPLPAPIIDYQTDSSALAGCIMPRDGRQLTRTEQGECIRKHGKRIN